MMKVAAFATAVLLVHALAANEEVTPIEKVLTMMKDLQEKVVIEGKHEAVTYDKYACFCKDSTNEKAEAIEEQQNTVDALVAKINALNSDRNTIDDKIEELNDNIARLTKEMEEETKTHLANKAIYEADRAEISKSIDGVNDAVGTISEKAGVPTHRAALVAMTRKVKSNLRDVLETADKLGLAKPEYHRNVQAFLQLAEDPAALAEATSYENNEELGAVLGTLENLDNDFVSQRKQLDATETKRVFSYDSFMQQRHDEKKANNKSLRQQREMHGKKMAQKAEANQELTQETASLHDDQAYIQDLTEKCNAKSQEWDERTDMRTSELSALTNAIHIIQKRIHEALDSSSKRKNHDLIQVAEDDDVEGEDSVVFLQVKDSVAHSPRAQFSKYSLLAVAKKPAHGDLNEGFENARSRALDLLRSRGEELKSTMLVNLANKVSTGADPFEKIKTLIQELIGRLQAEAADEASHKGWCDKSLGDAEIRRDDEIAKITNLNNVIARNQNRKDKLVERIAELTASISDLEDEKSQFTKMRNDEKAENEHTISEAETGLTAIEDAITVLKDFYEDAATDDLLQVKADPKKSKDNDLKGKYKGDQSAATGILGMMDVIRGDFKRNIRITGEEEDKANRDFLGLERETQISIDTKTDEKSAKESDLSSTKDKIRTGLTDLEQEQGLFDKAIQELQELVPACIDTGMSYEDRVAKREQEIESMNQALCILEQQGPTKESTQTCD